MHEVYKVYKVYKMYKVYKAYKVHKMWKITKCIKCMRCIKCIKCVKCIKCCSPPAPQASYPTSVGFVGMIKIISNRKTTKMRYCEYSYGVNCVCFLPALFFYASIVVDYVNKKQHQMGYQKQLEKSLGPQIQPSCIKNWSKKLRHLKLWKRKPRVNGYLTFGVHRG